MRARILALVLAMAAPALANTSHHSSGGGGSSVEGQCLRWEPITPDGGGPSDLGARDLGSAAAPDGGEPVDAGRPVDAGTHAGMRCVERAGLFACDYAGGAGRAEVGWGAPALAALFAAGLLSRSRGRRRVGATGRA